MNVIHISYRDKTNGTLKYATNAGGMWTTSIVDNSADVGLYTSLKIGPDGKPRIAYMMLDGTVGADPTKRTGLKLATANSASPAGPTDWMTEVLDSEPKPVPICGGGCPSNQACVDPGGGPSCIDTTIGCGMCSSSQACVMTMTATAPKCLAKVEAVPLDDFTPGTGLFASLALTSTGSPVIAYYDRLNTRLRLARSNGSGGWNLDTIAAGTMANPLDVGQHCSVAITPTGGIAVAYYDATNENLIYSEVSTATITHEVVDNGLAPNNPRMVGADASLLFDDMGHPAIAYQDPTNIDLLYARKIGSPPMWSVEVLRGAPPPGGMMGTASGFYATQARNGGTAYIGSVDVGFTADDTLDLILSVLVKMLD
jgi:hypothetical protein